MTDGERPASTPLAGEDQPIFEVVALLLHAAMNTASRQPFRAGRSPLAMRLLLVHHDVRNRLPVGHRISPDAHTAARPYIEPAEQIKDPNARVVHLLEAVSEVLAAHPGHHARLSDLAIKVSDLLQEAKSAPSF